MTMHNEQRAERLCDIILRSGLREGEKLRCTEDLDSFDEDRPNLEGLTITFRGLQNWNTRGRRPVAHLLTEKTLCDVYVDLSARIYFVRVEERPPAPTPTKPLKAADETALPGRIRSAVADLNALLNHAAQAGLEVRIAARETTTIGDGSPRVTVEADILKRL